MREKGGTNTLGSWWYLLKVKVGMPNDPETPASTAQEKYIRKIIYRMCIILVLITTNTLKLLK